MLAFKAKELLQKAVAKASHGKYRLEAKQVTFQYMHPGIKATAVQLLPNSKAQRQGFATFGKVDIQLKSLWHFVFQKRMEVNHILLSDVSIEAFAQNRSGVEKKGIAEATRQVQEKLLAGIASLNIKNLSILNAAVTLHTADTMQTEYLSFNHLDLVFNNIVLAKDESTGRPIFKMDGYLHLKHPEIHLPSKTSTLKIGSLKANIADSSLAIDSLAITIGAGKAHPQKVSLAALDIDGFHWNHYLNTGILEFDSLMAKKGRAEIDLTSTKKTEEHGVDTVPKKYMGSSFIIHHTLISNISYHLTSLAKKGKMKGDPVSMDLDGDSLLLKDISIIHGRSPVADVEQLEMDIKNFRLSDSLQKQRIAMDGFSINKKNLDIKNYLLETNKNDQTSNYLKISIPHFQLTHFSLDELLQKELSASRIELDSPEIMVDIRKIKPKESTVSHPKSNINNTIAAITESLSKKVTLGEIAIRNGNFVLLPTLDPNDQVKLTGLSMVIDASQLPKISSAMDLIHAIKTLNSTGFSVVGKNVSLHIRDMQLLNNPRGVFFGSISGKFGEGKMVDLKGVTILNSNKDFDPTQAEGLHVSDLLADSGSITVLVNNKTQQKKQAAAALPAILIDNLDLNHLVFKLKKEGKVGVSTALEVAATNFALKDGKAFWKTLEVGAVRPGATIEKTSFDAASMTVTQPGFIRITQPSGKTNFNSGQVSFTADELLVAVGIQSSAVSKLKIELLQLVKPALQVSMKQQVVAAEQVPNNTTDDSPLDIALDELELVQPTLEFVMTDSNGTRIQSHRTYSGTLTLQQLKTMDENGSPLLSASHIRYQTNNPKVEFKERTIEPAALGFTASNLAYNPQKKILRLHVDSAFIHQISQTLIGKKQDTLHLSVGHLSAGNFLFDKKDTLDWQQLIRTVSWRATDLNLAYHTPKQMIHAWGIKVAGNQIISLSLDSFAINHRLSRAEVWASTPYEKGYETIKGGAIRANDISLAFNNKKPVVSIQKLHSNNLHFTTAKDKTKQEDTIDYRPLLTKTLMKIPLDLFMDSLLIANARVEANEISKKTGQETSIFFTEVNGYLQNVKTRNVQPADTLDMRIRARFYGTDVVRLHFRQSYFDSLQEFWMRVRMSHFEMPEMNRLLVPLMGLKIQAGTVDSLLMVAKGNDYFAYGTMDLRFHNLKVKLLKTEETKGKFFIGIANFATSVFLRKHDNSRTNLLYKERIRKRSIFNFWGKIALEGLLTNLGIKSDRKERRKFKKSLEALNLPDKYWQDEDND